MSTLVQYNLNNNNPNFNKVVKQNELFTTIIQKFHDKHKFNVSFMLYCFRNSNSKYYNLKFHIITYCIRTYPLIIKIINIIDKIYKELFLFLFQSWK